MTMRGLMTYDSFSVSDQLQNMKHRLIRAT